MNKYLNDLLWGGLGLRFKLLKLNFLDNCIFTTMYYLIYGNFDQVYACWE